MDLYIFYGLSVLMIFSSIMVLVSKKGIHSLLYLIFSFFTLAGHYVLLNAQFLAVVHIIVYAGAIMVLFLFTVMLLNLNVASEVPKSMKARIVVVITGGLLLVTLICALKGLEIEVTPIIHSTQIGTVQVLGKLLYSEYLIPFEIASVLFLSAMVGSVMLGKKEMNF
jgi:NADH-quinone oxidoreductase subunit J